jgi:predicted dehydrogenase
MRKEQGFLKGGTALTTLGFGIVGCGFFGGEFARILNNLEGTRTIAVYGGSGKSTNLISKEIGCDIEETLESLVTRDDIDAIIVASPNHLHKEPVLQAAINKKHVFCEKPVALTLDDCNEMIGACKDNAVYFMAGHILHFISGIKKIKEWIESGLIGRPLVCHSERTGWEERQSFINWKKQQSKSGGHLFHHIHELDFIQSIVGPATSVYMTGGNLAHNSEDFGNEDDVLLLNLEFPNGSVGSMQYGSGFRWGEHHIKINGTEGAILLNFKKSTIELKKNNIVTTYMLHDLSEENEERRKIYESMDGGVIYGNPALRPPLFLQNAMKAEMIYFRDVILGNPIEKNMRLLFDGTAARTSVSTASAAIRSLKEKRRIPL